MELMRALPDKCFELAIVDPPYGIGEDGKKNHSRGGLAKPTLYANKQWDREKPPITLFSELKRVSKNQIIWGANHFVENIPNANSSCWVVWDKDNSGNFADCELAWTSFKTAVRIFKYRWNGMLQQNMKDKEVRFHPTQKPIDLYSWLLNNYAHKSDRILDTHLGSGSSRIAAWQAEYDFLGAEIDADYFKAQEERYASYAAQYKLTEV